MISHPRQTDQTDDRTPRTRASRPRHNSAALDLERVLGRYREPLAAGLRIAVDQARIASVGNDSPARPLLDELFGQLEYYYGWRETDLSPASGATNSGKLLRPTLLLLATELAAGRASDDQDATTRAVRAALPAALAVEMVHNFSLIHDDIEDGDEERHHRPTLWKLWGVPQAINTGDALFSLARAQLWGLAGTGTRPATIIRLAQILDDACVTLCAGQFLDIRYEGRQDVSMALYLEMIARKTAALMACAMEMGAILGAPRAPAVARAAREFGEALGMAFQLRDDLLGIWAAKDLGKSGAGDLRRKKMSLPVIAAMEHAASTDDRETLTAIYAANGPASESEIATLLGILERADARGRARAMLRERSEQARAALDAIAARSETAQRARDELRVLLAYVAAEGV